MKFLNFVLICALGLAGAAYAQVPAGTWTGNDLSDGSGNTGMGTGALGGSASTNTGTGNTASGYDALNSNSNGSYNTAVGYLALLNNGLYGDGSGNTALGVDALYLNWNGDNNTATGAGALYGSYTIYLDPFGEYGPGGSGNTGTGVNALHSYRGGGNNTADGMNALFYNSNGNYNTASGYEAMYGNTLGAQNSAYGSFALRTNAKGNYNTGMGGYALYSNNSGSSNIALGYKAGFYPTAGANNIHIGNIGAAGDTAIIKIGNQGTQSAAYIAGISGVTVNGTGTPVVVNTSGQLGTAGSSERFKTEIAPMGQSTEKLAELRPVTFRYRTEPHGARQFGLVAEEVAKVYPELVVRDAKGSVISVRYDELAPMLLNVVQKQQEQLSDQNTRIGNQGAELSELKASLRALQEQQKKR